MFSSSWQDTLQIPRILPFSLFGFSMTANSSKKDTKTFSIISGLDVGLFAPEDLEEIIKIINQYDIPKAKITSAQRFALLGIKQKEMEILRKKLKDYIKTPPVNGVDYVHACPGLDWCKFGIRDSQSLGKKLEEISMNSPFTTKVKVGVSGCQRCCTEPYIRDLGIFASAKGWTLVFGGNGGRRARIADNIATDLSDKGAIDLAKKCLRVYQREAPPILEQPAL